MSNSNSNKKKNKPAAVKSAAGKTNSQKKPSDNKNKEKERQRAEAEKQAKRLIEEKQKQKKQQQKKSEEIHKRRAKADEKNQKIQKKTEIKTGRKKKRTDKLNKIREKIKYLTSKEFLSSINYLRVFVFIILPVVLIVVGGIGISRTVVLNVPSEIRSYDFGGRLESESAAKPSVFNSQQQQVFIDALKASGSRKFDFYINSVVPVDDDGVTDELCFGNPTGNDYVLIATVFDKNDEIIYRSLGLESGKEINNAKMFTSLSYGLHEVKVAVNAYDRKTNEKIGTKYAAIKLAVGVDENGR